MLFPPSTGKNLHIFSVFKASQPTSPEQTDVTMSFSKDERLLAIAADALEIWDTQTGLLRRRIPTTTGPIFQLPHDKLLAFSPDDTLIATTDDKIVRLWNTNTGQLYRELKGHSDSVTRIAFSPDGMTLATGSTDGTVKLWRIK